MLASVHGNAPEYKTPCEEGPVKVRERLELDEKEEQEKSHLKDKMDTIY